MTAEKALSHGVERVGRRDAWLLLSHITGYSVGDLHLNFENELGDYEYNLYFSFLERRLTGEPLQYIIGQWDFMGLTFFTDKRALIPRQETELLVEEAMKFIKEVSHGEEKIRILDICTGSGCIALSLACMLGESIEITAVDISVEALSLAKENAEKSGISTERVNFIESDLLDNVSGEFDVIISNPPYILSGDMAELSPTVRDHEPRLALDGGVDGLDIYRRLIPQSKNALCKGGALFLEIGPASVMDLMADAGFENKKLLRDYANLERIITGVKKNV